MKETNHDYQNCLSQIYYDKDGKCTGEYKSWEDFKSDYLGFCLDGFDDKYHFVFRYDISKQEDGNYYLELCVMLQRKGIYTHLYIKNIDQETLDTEVRNWLKERKHYMEILWNDLD